ncbi:MAG: amino acid adenylation domain-containing protein [Rhodospirillum sp.]|nr:amino acid adenylation domain-containing protein [Rhodospirillum sp.]MCF8488362.1 amino acid adenylation domain-containing protein [Rhodospirillum sp.]
MPNELSAKLDRLTPRQRELLERRRKGTNVAPKAPKPRRDDASRYDPFPLTNVQQAYWIGRDPNLNLGGVAAYGYGEFDVEGLSIDGLVAAWNKLIERHPVLRTVLTGDGRQKFLESVPPYEIQVNDTSALAPDERAEILLETRERLSHQAFDCQKWPLFDVQATRVTKERYRIHVGFETLIVDARSFDILANELDQLLRDPAAALPALNVTFNDYINTVFGNENADRRERAKAYWHDRLDSLPPSPPLPQRQAGGASSHRFKRLRHGIARGHWDKICAAAADRQLTASSVLLAAFSDVMARWSGADDFTLNLTLFNRRPIDPDIDNVVGCFTDLALLEVNHDGGACFESRARAIQTQLWNDLDHRDFDAMDVMRELAHRTGEHRLMPVVFTSALGSANGTRGCLGNPVYAISQTPQVSIDCQIVEAGAGIDVWWDVAEDVFPTGLVEAMFHAFSGIIERVAADARVWKACELITPPAAQGRARQALESSRTFAVSGLLHDLFDTSAPSRLAVDGEAGAVSYADLDSWASRIAAELQRRHLGYQDRVGVSLERGPAQIAAVLGILRCGIAYVPLSPGLPPARLADLIAKAGITLVFTDNDRTDAKLPDGVASIRMDRPVPDGTPRPVAVKPNDLAYVIFTSGTTGTPKGVMISHQSAVNTIVDMVERLGMTRKDVLLGLSDLSFDLSVFDIFGALAMGATLITTGSGQRTRDPAHFLGLIDRHGVTIWNSVPAIMGMLVDYMEATGRRAPGLRVVFMSGDWIPIDLPDRIFAAAPNASVFSGGGATEASIWSVSYHVDETRPCWTSVPYGAPLTNQSARVRDSLGQEAPDWVLGELHIGGSGVALGYLGDPVLTAEKFVPDPNGHGVRLYRTGDVARHLDDGMLELWGRTDSQVKINGFRVDLSEIDSELLSHPMIWNACTLAVGNPGEPRGLRAFVIADPQVSMESVRHRLAQRLPDYMVPAIIEGIDALPLTPNGKIDRQSLAARPLPGGPLSGSLAAPMMTVVGRPVAETLFDIVNSELNLGQAPLDPRRELISLGADSLSILRILNEIRKRLGVEMGLRQVLSEPSLGAIATHIERRLITIALETSRPDHIDTDTQAAPARRYESGEL